MSSSISHLLRIFLRLSFVLFLLLLLSQLLLLLGCLHAIMLRHRVQNGLHKAALRVRSIVVVTSGVTLSPTSTCVVGGGHWRSGLGIAGCTVMLTTAAIGASRWDRCAGGRLRSARIVRDIIVRRRFRRRLRAAFLVALRLAGSPIASILRLS